MILKLDGAKDPTNFMNLLMTLIMWLSFEKH